ncbi:MAG: hypothetical protein A2857_06685 [Candidatus Levybacteria bacterium RIFCSPHIGHO2_01_FULL_36_15]|nr:MAG: hypothetical protein A2857_06685 [Candidatus Levybacteria bacterium RIFCSPHIGHO2_01_FULL_36_15]OGH37784.1 MAG: hypothetical protein A2905_00010 [Candidatus Levybacteria bacterium RIFCSPLOWO2_01_FULL_36_10]
MRIKLTKLKIAILDFDDIKNPLLAAGQAKATLEVGKRLAEKGHKITVVSSRFPGYKDRFENGMKYIHIGLGSNNIRLNNIFYILTLPFYVIKLNSNVIIECFTSPISTLFTPLWTKIPVVAIPTSFEADRFSRLYKLPFDLIEKFGCRFYRYFLPYTESLDLRMKKYNPKIVSKIVPEGVGNEFFKIKARIPKHILFLGRFDINQKGIDLLLKAYSGVAKEIKYPLVIAGNGPDEQKIKLLITKLNLDKYVRMVGPAYGQKKKNILSEALYIAFPSRHEGFSLFSLEALASGLPLICFDIPALKWADKRVALKARPFDVKEYSRLIKLAANKKFINSMRKNTRIVARKYSWSNVANEYDVFLKTILSDKYAN